MMAVHLCVHTTSFVLVIKLKIKEGKTFMYADVFVTNFDSYCLVN
jgi:hypothetical protein